MLYENYQRRILKVAALIRQIKRYRVLIIAVAFAILAVFAAMMSFKGTIYNVSEIPAVIVYGDKVPVKASAFLSDAGFEYAAAGTDEWNNVQPRGVGAYKVRAKGSRLFRSNDYGKEQSYQIVPKAVEVSVKESVLQYGDMPTLAAQLAYGDVISCSVFEYGDLLQTRTSVKADVNSIIITDKEGNNVTHFYTLSTAASDISFTKRAVTVETLSATKVYDGTPLSSDSLEITNGSAANGDTVFGTFSGSQTLAGSSKNTAEFYVLDSGGEDVTRHYDIKTQFGNLNVTKRPLRISTFNAQKVYDGIPLSHTDFGIDAGTPLVSGHDAVLYSAASLTNAGACANTVTVKIMLGGEEVSANYNIEYNSGTLSVNARTVRVKTADSELVYDGTAQFDYFFEFISSSLAAGDSATAVKNFAGITNVGSAENRFSVEIKGANGGNADDNYTVSYTYGTISILRRAVLAKTATADLYYNGESQYNLNFEVLYLASGQTAKAVEANYTTLKDIEKVAGGYRKYSNIFEIRIFSGISDVTNNYDIFYEYGILQMLPCLITVKTGSKEFVYDGQKQFDDTFTISPNVADRHVVRLKEGTLTYITDVERGEGGAVLGRYNVLEVAVFEGSKDVSDNYSLVYDYGVLTMKPRPIEIKTASNSWEYDGNPHSDSNHSLIAGSLVSGHQTSANADLTEAVNVVRLTNGTVGTINNVFTVDIFFDGANVTHNYNIKYSYGALKITPKGITVATGSYIFEYDGAGHYYEWHTTAGLIDGHSSRAIFETLTIAVNVKRLSDGTVAGISNVFKVEVYGGGENLTHNYNMAYTYGTLTITPRRITVAPQYAWKPYDRTPLMPYTYTVTSATDIVEGQYAIASFNGSQTEIGSSVSSITAFTIYWGADNATKNYEITFETGTLAVYKRDIFVEASSAAKIYDTTPLTCADYMVWGDGMLYGHYLSAVTFGSQTEVGKSDNIIVESSLEILDWASNDDVSEYYNVYFRNGTLHVGLREVTFTTASNQKEYDGTPLTDGGYEIIGELLEGDTYRVQVSGWIVNVGWTTNWGYVYFSNAQGVDTTDCYIITTDWGTLTITGDMGGADIDLDGGIGGESGGDGSNARIFTATSSTQSMVYFRIKSFGDYAITKWNNAPSYSVGGVNALYFMHSALAQKSGGFSSIKIEPVSRNLSYMLPYYASNGYLTLEDTVMAAPYSSPYHINYIPYDYNAQDKLSVLSSYKGAEQEYYNFVLNTYLNLPESTRTKLLEIAASNNLNGSSTSIIDDVANFVSKAVKYSRRPEQYLGDNAIYFFTQAKTGLCSHYATAATAMFRALGIPARYTVGFVAQMSAEKAVDVFAGQAHAWVEVYIKGAGWVQIEVTGGGEGNPSGGVEGSGGGTGGTETGGEEQYKDLIIKPIDVQKAYDGTPLYAVNEIEGVDALSVSNLQHLLSLGYYYTVSVSGYRTELGVSYSTINNFVLYDSFGNNITNQFDIAYRPGRIRVTGTPIYINLYSISKTYDGTPLSYKPKDYWVEQMPNGLILDFNLRGSLTDAGVLYKGDLEDLSFTVRDQYGRDVSADYSLIFLGEPLTVNKRMIEITSASAKKTYDGTPLTDERTWVSKGYIPSNHTYEAEVVGSVVDIGTGLNTIKSIKILDGSLKSVTNNYKITFVFGILTVT